MNVAGKRRIFLELVTPMLLCKSGIRKVFGAGFLELARGHAGLDRSGRGAALCRMFSGTLATSLDARSSRRCRMSLENQDCPRLIWAMQTV